MTYAYVGPLLKGINGRQAEEEKEKMDGWFLNDIYDLQLYRRITALHLVCHFPLLHSSSSCSSTASPSPSRLGFTPFFKLFMARLAQLVWRCPLGRVGKKMKSKEEDLKCCLLIHGITLSINPGKARLVR